MTGERKGCQPCGENSYGCGGYKIRKKATVQPVDSATLCLDRIAATTALLLDYLCCQIAFGLQLRVLHLDDSTELKGCEGMGMLVVASSGFGG